MECLFGLMLEEVRPVVDCWFGLPPGRGRVDGLSTWAGGGGCATLGGLLVWARRARLQTRETITAAVEQARRQAGQPHPPIQTTECLKFDFITNS